MKRLETFSGQVITSRDLDYLQRTKEEAISERYHDILTDGIFRTSATGVSGEFAITENTPSTFNVGSGSAKVTQGKLSQRIVIPLDEDTTYDESRITLTPAKSSGNKNISLLGGENDTNYIYIEYVQTYGDTQSTHWDTGEIHYTDAEDGYHIIRSLTLLSPPELSYRPIVFIGTVTRIGSGLVISYDGRKYVTLRSAFASELEPSLVEYQDDTTSSGIISDEKHGSFIRENFHLGYIYGFTPSQSTNLREDWKVAQSLTPESEIKLSSISFNIRRADTVDPSPNLLVRVYKDDGGNPSAPDVSNVLATSLVHRKEVEISFSWINFYFEDDLILSPGTKYWFSVEKETPDDSNYYISSIVAGANSYGGSDYYQAVLESPPDWAVSTDRDLHFKLFSADIESTILTANLTIDRGYTSVNVPTLWLDRLINRGIKNEKVYVRGVKIDEFITLEEKDYLVDGQLIRRARVDTASVTNSGEYSIVVNSAGEIGATDTTSSNEFVLWEVEYDASLREFINITDKRQYRLITARDIRGMGTVTGTDFVFGDVIYHSGIVSTGGNPRGPGSADLQTDRNQGTQVASGSKSVIGGGSENTASGDGSTISGGEDNIASGQYSSINGGQSNSALFDYSTIGGGSENTSGPFSVVAGGVSNYALGETSFIGGGVENRIWRIEGHGAQPAYAVIGGGYGNVAEGDNSSILGGFYNEASGHWSTVGGGRRLKSTAQGSYTIGDSQNVDFINDVEDGFYARFQGGLRFGNGTTDFLHLTEDGDAIFSGTISSLTDDTWHNVGTSGQPGYLNGFVGYLPETRHGAGFFRTRENIVHLRGEVTGGSQNSDIFKLPEGYRPSKRIDLLVSGAGGHVTLSIYADGGVVPYSGYSPTYYVSLDGVSFPTSG